MTLASGKVISRQFHSCLKWALATTSKRYVSKERGEAPTNCWVIVQCLAIDITNRILGVAYRHAATNEFLSNRLWGGSANHLRSSFIHARGDIPSLRKQPPVPIRFCCACGRNTPVNLVDFLDYTLIDRKKIFRPLGPLAIEPPHSACAIVQILRAVRVLVLLVDIDCYHRVINSGD